MKLPPEERAALRESFRKMTPAAKAEYIFTYFKAPILLTVIAVIILCSAVYRQMTRLDVAVYAAYINVSVGDDLQSRLNEGYLADAGLDPKKNKVFLYRDLYLSNDPSDENHEFAYASKMKVLATVSDQELDLVFMNREAYDILSASGYLMDLSGLFADNSLLQPHLTANVVVLEDNAIDYDLGNAEEYWQVTEDAVNAVEVSAFPMFAQAGFPDSVYLGIIGNTPRLTDCTDYLTYLASAAA